MWKNVYKKCVHVKKNAYILIFEGGGIFYLIVFFRPGTGQSINVHSAHQPVLAWYWHINVPTNRYSLPGSSLVVAH